MDTKPSVISGGLVRKDGTSKPVLERISALIQQWTTNITVIPDEHGGATLEAFAGDYEIVVTSPSGTTTHTLHLPERATTTLNIDLGNPS